LSKGSTGARCWGRFTPGLPFPVSNKPKGEKGGIVNGNNLGTITPEGRIAVRGTALNSLMDKGLRVGNA